MGMIDAYIELIGSDGKPIEGETSDAVYGKSKLIEITKFSLDANSKPDVEFLTGGVKKPPAENTSGGAPSSLGESVSQDHSFGFKIGKRLDISSRYLFLNYCKTAAKGEDRPVFPKVTVYFRKAGSGMEATSPKEASFLSIEFTEVYVGQYSISSEKESSVPKENISFLFNESYTVTYKWQDLDGVLQPPITQGYNLKTDETI